MLDTKNSKYLLVGLGNYGKEYFNTIHNIGFIILDFLIGKLEIKMKYQKKFLGEVGKIHFKDKEIILLKPYTFMNRSGKSVKSLVSYFKIPMENIIILYDDFDLLWGRFRIRFSGSSAGHKGVESIIKDLESKNFWRFRYGVKKEEILNLEKYVLSKIPEEKKIILDWYKKTTFNIFNQFLKDFKLENQTYTFDK